MIRNIKVDGMEMGEAGINARLAWEYGVPVILVSGDDLLKQQIEEELGKEVSYVETKKQSILNVLFAAAGIHL